MLKKLLTGCLTIAMATALATSAMAADMSSKVGGRATASLASITYTPNEGDGYSYMDMEAEGRIDYSVTYTDGDWSFGGKVEYRSSFGNEAYTSPVTLQKYFQLQNDQFSLALGTKWFGFAYLTPFVGLNGHVDRNCYGCLDLRNDRLEFKLKEVGLTIVYGVNTEANDTTGDDYTATHIGLMYSGKFGPLTLGLQYGSIANAMVENKNSTTEDSTTKDGTSSTQTTLLVQYAISEAMFVEFDYESQAVVAVKDGDPANTATMGLAFSMALSEAQGFTFAYDTSTADQGTSESEDDSTTVLMTLYFVQKIASQSLFAGYNSSATSVDGESTGSTTAIAFGGRINF